MIKDILIYYTLPLLVVNACILVIARYDAIKDGIVCSKIDRVAKTGEPEPLRDLWHLMERFKEMALIVLGVFIGLFIGVLWIKGFLVSPVFLLGFYFVITILNIVFSHYIIWNTTFLKRNTYLNKEDVWQMPIPLPKWLEKFLGFHH